MKTIFEKTGLDEEKDNRIYEMASEILNRGGLVAFPTETVYGLGGNALDGEAAAKIYAAKGRPSDNPLIIHIADIDALKVLCSEIPPLAYSLAEHFWPGPLTMIMKKTEIVPHATTGGLDTVAVRMPNNRTALELIRRSGVYVAAPSANLSGRPSPTKAEHVRQDMDGRIDMIIDGGNGDIGIESTIIDLTDKVPVILRPGYITKEMLEAVIGPVDIDKAVALGKQSDAPPKAPGMKYRHYAPRGEMVIVEGKDPDCVTEKINRLAAQKKKEGMKTGILATDETEPFYKADYVISVGTRGSELSISSHLFDVLRQFDDLGVQYIVSEGFSRENVGYAIMNRLLKAAGGKIINTDESEE
ncbi:MAG: L-threonylcarbamoyladenylate synthase [Thermoflexaceae bacterium]|nr:L-threonylcarbamoyladenylate synthase [Thermoflexaceae bacterium]